MRRINDKYQESLKIYYSGTKLWDTYVGTHFVVIGEKL